MNNPIFSLLIFPGFVFTAIIGILVSWIDRKVTARVQWRKGPPLLQPLYDLIKLSGKETILPKNGAQMLFLLAPIVGLAGVVFVSAMIWRSLIDPTEGFMGDLIVLLYLLTLPSISVIIGGFASGNSLASQGASREMKLILAYELPFILAAAVIIINCGYSIKLGDLTISYTVSFSGIIALIVAVICQQAKLALVPFDMAEAETEIMAGAIIEYSGVTLLVHKLTRMMMLFVVPMFVVAVFLGGIDFSTGGSAAIGFLKYVALLVVTVLIRNTAPRLRIDQAMRFFWGPVTILALIAVILALMGH
jgi:NADH-quinone oxidoreductase subunit H